MPYHSEVNTLSGYKIEIFLTTACIAILVYKILKYLGSNAKQSLNTSRRRLELVEDVFHTLAMEENGSGNICMVLCITSKQALVHQHVRDALVLLATRQPMVRAIVATMADGHKYFEIKEINDVIPMLDIAASDVKASDWKDVWCEYTAKLGVNNLLWRLVILKEEFEEDTNNYRNTLMFSLSHSCFDGVSSVKFCKQFLTNMNELANGNISVNQEVTSLGLLPHYHDIVIRGRVWHSIFNFMLTCCGLRPVFKSFMQRFLVRLIATKPNNPYYEKFFMNIDNSKSPEQDLTSQLAARVFTEDETNAIIQACKVHNCTVTGATTAAAHLSFCELVQDDKFNNAELHCPVAVESRRFCDTKPHEDYLGHFVYLSQDVYFRYAAGADVDFWKLARESSQRIKDRVRKETFVAEQTVASGLMNAKEYLDLFGGDKFFPIKSGCNLISSYGRFSFGKPQGKHSCADTYKLDCCFLNAVVLRGNMTFYHFIYTIDGILSWNIVSDTRVNTSHFEKFANLCFNMLSEMSVNEFE